MKTRQFHLGDVLSVTTRVLVSPRYTDGVRDLLSFMIESDLFSHQIQRASEECRPFLLQQFPQFDTPEMDFEVAKLGEMLKTRSGKTDEKKVIIGWLSGLTKKHGEYLEVAPAPEGALERRDPFTELYEMASNGKVIVA